MSDDEIENSSSTSVTSVEVACEIEAVIDLSTQQMTRLFGWVRELKEKQSSRHHETTFFRATSSLSGRGSQFDSNLTCKAKIFRHKFFPQEENHQISM